MNILRQVCNFIAQHEASKKTCVSPLEVDRAHVVLYLPPRFDGSVQPRTLSYVATASSAGRSPAICPAGLVRAA